jgi:hypothetical protein
MYLSAGSAASGNERKLSTIGPDDMVAVAAVGKAAIHGVRLSENQRLTCCVFPSAIPLTPIRAASGWRIQAIDYSNY